jgi:hypothetical protein
MKYKHFEVYLSKIVRQTYIVKPTLTPSLNFQFYLELFSSFQMIITGDSKGILKFWRFATNGKFGKDFKLESNLCKMELHRPSSLLAVGLSDFTIQVNF